MTRYQKTIERIESGSLSREELSTLQNNARNLLEKGDEEAAKVLAAINLGKPEDDFIYFIGFCPNADSGNRLDIEWKSKGICTWDYYEDELQTRDFTNIWPGDLIVLKKSKNRSEHTMTVHGYGRVTEVAFDDRNRRYLKVNWASQEKVIVVPDLAAFKTINPRPMDVIMKKMPKEFFDWLNS